jgi:hypothetical protein
MSEVDVRERQEIPQRFRLARREGEGVLAGRGAAEEGKDGGGEEVVEGVGTGAFVPSSANEGDVVRVAVGGEEEAEEEGEFGLLEGERLGFL